MLIQQIRQYSQSAPFPKLHFIHCYLIVTIADAVFKRTLDSRFSSCLSSPDYPSSSSVVCTKQTDSIRLDQSISTVPVFLCISIMQVVVRAFFTSVTSRRYFHSLYSAILNMDPIIANLKCRLPVRHDQTGLLLQRRNIPKQLCLRLFVQRTGAFIQ